MERVLVRLIKRDEKVLRFNIEDKTYDIFLRLNIARGPNSKVCVGQNI